MKLSVLGQGSLALFLTAVAAAQNTTLMSTGQGGAPADGLSLLPSVSGFDAAASISGRYVAFASEATNLLPTPTTGTRQIYRKDRWTGAVLLVSVAATGGEGDAGSERPSISADGNIVAFQSLATNLVVPGASGTNQQIYVRNIGAGITTLVSQDSLGGESDAGAVFPWISGDGSTIVFHSKATDLTVGTSGLVNNVYRWRAGTIDLVSSSFFVAGLEGNHNSINASVSRDGNVVAFQSRANDLVALDVGPFQDVFVRNMTSGVTTLASVAAGGTQANRNSTNPRLAVDGDCVVFQSFADNLVTGDTNGWFDVFLRDIARDVTVRVSVATGGGEGNGNSGVSAASRDGRFVAFHSIANNLVPSDFNGVQDIFVYDRNTSITQRLNVDAGGNEGDAGSGQVSISEDGNVVAFQSRASNLVPGDTNNLQDVFLSETVPPVFTYCTAKVNSCGSTPTISGTGLASATLLSGFVISGDKAIDGRYGVLIYTAAGKRFPAAPFAGTGYLCIESPIHRTDVILATGGTPGACDAAFSIDMNAFAHGQLAGWPPQPVLTVIGAQIDCQIWGRDTQAHGEYLTDALEFRVGP